MFLIIFHHGFLENGLYYFHFIFYNASELYKSGNSIFDEKQLLFISEQCVFIYNQFLSGL